MTIFNPINVLDMLHEYFKYEGVATSPTAQEIVVKDNILDILIKCQESAANHFESETTLDVLEDLNEDESIDMYCDDEEVEKKEEREQTDEELMSLVKATSTLTAISGISGSSASIPPSPGKAARKDKNPVSFEYKRRCVNYWKFDNNGKVRKKSLRWSTLQNRFKLCKSRGALYKWIDDVDKMGTNRDKMNIVREETFSKFKEARLKRYTVYDYNLEYWALEKSRELGITSNFRASSKWINYFKRAKELIVLEIERLQSSFLNITQWMSLIMRQMLTDFSRKLVKTSRNTMKVMSGMLTNQDLIKKLYLEELWNLLVQKKYSEVSNRLQQQLILTQ